MVKSGVLRMMVAHTTLPPEFVAIMDHILNGKTRSPAEVELMLREYLGEDEHAKERDLACHLAGKALDKHKSTGDVSVCIKTLKAIAAFCPDITGHHTHCGECDMPYSTDNHAVCIYCLADETETAEPSSCRAEKIQAARIKVEEDEETE